MSMGRRSEDEAEVVALGCTGRVYSLRGPGRCQADGSQTRLVKPFKPRRFSVSIRGTPSEEHPPLTRETYASSSPPSAFGRFRVVHQVGAGVLGPVFRGYDPETDRTVAVKSFPLDITPEQAERAGRRVRPPGHARPRRTRR